MALLGSPVLGHVIADRSGHSLHLGLMKTIVDNPHCWGAVTFQKRGESLLRQVVHSTQTSGHRFAPFFAPVGESMAARQACAM